MTSPRKEFSDGLKIAIAGMGFIIFVIFLRFGMYQRVRRMFHIMGCISCPAVLLWCLDDEAYDNYIPELIGTDTTANCYAIIGAIIMYFLNRAAFVTVNDRELPDMYWKILVSFVSFMIVTEYIILIVAVATDNHFFLGLRDLWWVVLALFYLLISIISVSKIRKQLKSFHSRAELLQNDAKMYPINRAKKVSDPKTDFNTGLIIKAAEKLQIRLYVISFFAFALILVLIYAASQHFREDKGIRETYNETRGEYSLAEDFNRWAATAWVPFLVWYSYVPIKGLTFNTSTVVPRSSHKTPNTMLRRGELGRSDASPRRVRSKVSPSTPRIVLVASPKGSDTPRISMVVGYKEICRFSHIFLVTSLVVLIYCE